VFLVGRLVVLEGAELHAAQASVVAGVPADHVPPAWSQKCCLTRINEQCVSHHAYLLSRYTLHSDR